MGNKQYVCVNIMCGVWTDEPGPCKRCGREVQFFDEENAIFAPRPPPRPSKETDENSPGKGPAEKDDSEPKTDK